VRMNKAKGSQRRCGAAEWAPLSCASRFQTSANCRAFSLPLGAAQKKRVECIALRKSSFTQHITHAGLDLRGSEAYRAITPSKIASQLPSIGRAAPSCAEIACRELMRALTLLWWRFLITPTRFSNLAPSLPLDQSTPLLPLILQQVASKQRILLRTASPTLPLCPSTERDWT